MKKKQLLTIYIDKVLEIKINIVKFLKLLILQKYFISKIKYLKYENLNSIENSYDCENYQFQISIFDLFKKDPDFNYLIWKKEKILLKNVKMNLKYLKKTIQILKI